MRDARAQYFREAGFADDGGYADKWVKLKKGERTLFAFPNTAARVRSVKLHDLHHVLTGYKTTWTGEAEIGAWEIASGCAHHLPAWILNLGAFAIGLAIAPRRVYAAFVRGRHSRNLYRREFEDALLERRVGELRADLAIDDHAPRATWNDRAAFLGWASASVLQYVPGAVVLLIVLRRVL